jgi:peptide/nickel transport system permease protein
MGTALAKIQDVLVGERYQAVREKTWKTFRTLVGRPMGAVGLAIIVFFVFMAVFAPIIAGPFPTYSPAVNLGSPNEPPSATFPLGTDKTGRSNFALLMYGARVSLIVGAAASLIATILGTAVGIAAGYYGRFPDQTLSWVTNFFLVIPWLPFVLVLVSVIRVTDFLPAEQENFASTIIAISLVSWPTTARVVRSKVLSVKTLTYVQRARAIGAEDAHIMWRHVFPVLGPLVFANTILTVSNAIWTESFLAFFKLSDPNFPSWGALIEQSWTNLDFLTGRYWAFLPPGVCITALVLAFTMVSRVLEEILNPRFRKR